MNDIVEDINDIIDTFDSIDLKKMPEETKKLVKNVDKTGEVVFKQFESIKEHKYVFGGLIATLYLLKKFN
jgi:hypothetical protein